MTAAKSKGPGDVVKDIKRKTRRVFNAEEKIRIILEGLKAEESISSICRREYHFREESMLQSRFKKLESRLQALSFFSIHR